MTTLTLELPDTVASELDAAVESGWFVSQEEAVRAAVRDLVNQKKLALQESQQLADIEWAANLASKQG